MHIGINILPNEFAYALELANKYPFVGFIQLDHVAGTYTSGKLDIQSYNDARDKSPMTKVFGGVWPKYYQPIGGSDFESDLKVGIQRADAIVITGPGTGKETPYDKIKKAREVIGEHPLIIGAGLTPDNAYKQLCISNGAIVGSSLKLNNDSYASLDRYRIRDLMDVVKEARDYQTVFLLNDS